MPMLQVCPVAFEVTGPHYDKLKRSFKRDWARQKRFGRRDALQETGIGEESITVSGVIYTDYFGGFNSVATLRSISGQPQMVVSGAGDVFGLWCIVEVDEEQSYLNASGEPGKVTFNLKLEAYGEDSAGDVLAGAAGSILGAIARLW